MLTKIKALADEAIKLQNKNRMDEVLRKISSICSLCDAEPEKEKAEEVKAEVAEEKPRKGGKNAK